MKTVERVHDRPQSRAECLGNIRKAIRMIPKCKWDEYDILNSDNKKALEVYSFLREGFKHSYAMKGI